jgi:hypothetical protein
MSQESSTKESGKIPSVVANQTGALMFKFSFYSSLPVRLPGEAEQERQFQNLVDALVAAFRVLRSGGSPTRVVYDDAVLFSGDDLIEVLQRISDNGGQPDAALAEVVRNTLPEVLIKQLVKTVKANVAILRNTSA